MKRFRTIRESGALSRRFGSSGPVFTPASAQFYGSSFLGIPNSAAFTLGTNNHTVEFWMYKTTNGQYDTVFSYDGSATGSGVNHYYFNTGTAQFLLIIGTGGGFFTVSCGAVPSANAWHHYAIVRNGNTFTVYIDGVSVGSGTYGASFPTQSGPMVVGAENSSGQSGITGYITNFRFVNGTALYTSNFNPVPTSSLTAITNTRVLIQGLVDKGPNTLTLTNFGGVTFSSQTPLTS